MTHIEDSSPLVARHHRNWRIKAMERHPVMKPKTELAYTAPMTLAESDVLKIRDGRRNFGLKAASAICSIYKLRWDGL
jgi:hypothetical protein